MLLFRHFVHAYSVVLHRKFGDKKDVGAPTSNEIDFACSNLLVTAVFAHPLDAVVFFIPTIHRFV